MSCIELNISNHTLFVCCIVCLCSDVTRNKKSNLYYRAGLLDLYILQEKVLKKQFLD